MEKHCQMLYPLLGEDMEVVFFRRKPYVNGNGEYPGIRFVDLPSTKIRGVEALVHSFLAAVCSLFLKPDAVHIHNIGPALMTPLLKMFGIPVVLTYHSANYEHKKWGAFARGLLRFSEKIALRWADRIIFVNRFQMEKFPEKIREKPRLTPEIVVILTVRPDGHGDRHLHHPADFRYKARGFDGELYGAKDLHRHLKRGGLAL